MSKQLENIITTISFSACDNAIDEANGIIKGVSVISKGEAQGYGAVVDETMIQQVCCAGRRSQKGVKCRFGHPSQNTNSLGTTLGRFRNFCIDGDDVRADLHLSESAKKSPMGDLHSYVISLAKSDSDLAGMSIAFEPAKPVFGDDGRTHFRLMHLSAIDLVDEPAATNGFFETETDNKIHKLTTQKEIDSMANEVIKTELEKATSEVELGKNTIMELTGKIADKDAEIAALSARSKEDAEKASVELSAKNSEIDAAKKSNEELSAKIAAVESSLAKANEELATFKKGASPIATIPADEVKKKSIFKNL